MRVPKIQSRTSLRLAYGAFYMVLKKISRHAHISYGRRNRRAGGPKLARLQPLW